MAKLTNEQKFKTAEERVRAFEDWCTDIRVGGECHACKLSKFASHWVCFAYWLALEAEDEKPEPCYGCGSPLTDFDIAYKAEQEGQYSGYSYHCVKCGFRTPYFRSKDELVAAHNRVARAVRAATTITTKERMNTMANPTKQLTVSDLEAAKTFANDAVQHAAVTKKKEMRIAATCIGIVEEMIKIGGVSKQSGGSWRSHDALRAVYCDDKTPHYLHNREGLVADCEFLVDVYHIVALHNLWLKAVAAFDRGENK